MNEPYKKISCDFYDELEASATIHKTCDIEFWDESGSKQIVNDRIKDLYTKDGIEFLKTATGIEIRLDRLIKVDGKTPSNQC